MLAAMIYAVTCVTCGVALNVASSSRSRSAAAFYALIAAISFVAGMISLAIIIPAPDADNTASNRAAASSGALIQQAKPGCDGMITHHSGPK